MGTWLYIHNVNIEERLANEGQYFLSIFLHLALVRNHWARAVVLNILITRHFIYTRGHYKSKTIVGGTRGGQSDCRGVGAPPRATMETLPLLGLSLFLYNGMIEFRPFSPFNEA